MPCGCPRMLLFLSLWALVPCLVLVTLYLFSSAGGKSGGNKKNDGVKVSPPGAWQGLPLAGFLSAGPDFQGWAKPHTSLLVFRADAFTRAAGPSPDQVAWASVPTLSWGSAGAGWEEGPVERGWGRQVAWSWGCSGGGFCGSPGLEDW